MAAKVKPLSTSAEVSTPPAPSDDASPDVMSLETRRGLLELVAFGDFDNLTLGDDKQTALSYVLQAIALELMATSIKLETETAPALAVVGAVIGGLLGIDNTSTEELMGRHARPSRRIA
jgi:hypothetical protein